MLTGWYGAENTGDAGEGAGDVGDSAGDRIASNGISRDVLYILKNYYSNSGDVRYSPSVDKDRYLAGTAHW